MSYTGPGGSGHIQALILNKFGYEPALTAYSSGSEGITAVLGKQVEFTNSNYATVASYIESGDLKLLAVCSDEPLGAHPEVPTLASVIEGSEELMKIPYSPLSLIVDKDVPAEVQVVLRDATMKAVEDPEFNAFMDKNSISKLYEKYPTIEDTKKFFDEWESTVSWMLCEAGGGAGGLRRVRRHRPGGYDRPRRKAAARRVRIQPRRPPRSHGHGGLRAFRGRRDEDRQSGVRLRFVPGLLGPYEHDRLRLRAQRLNGSDCSDNYVINR